MRKCKTWQKLSPFLARPIWQFSQLKALMLDVSKASSVSQEPLKGEEALESTPTRNCWITCVGRWGALFGGVRILTYNWPELPEAILGIRLPSQTEPALSTEELHWQLALRTEFTGVPRLFWRPGASVSATFEGGGMGGVSKGHAADACQHLEESSSKRPLQSASQTQQ